MAFLKRILKRVILFLQISISIVCLLIFIAIQLPLIILGGRIIISSIKRLINIYLRREMRDWFRLVTNQSSEDA